MSSTNGSRSEQAVHLQGAWTRPNAKCRACGQSVYFYESVDAGRVFSLHDPEIKRHGVGGSRWPLNGWKPLGSFEVSHVAAGGLYRVQGISEDDENVTLLFRMESQAHIEVVRYRRCRDDVIELSLLVRDRAERAWLIYTGSGKVAPSFPPSENLRLVERLEDASLADVVLNEVPVQTLVNCHAMRLQAEAIANRVVQLDGRVDSLLAELSQLNAEKTRLLRSLGSLVELDSN